MRRWKVSKDIICDPEKTIKFLIQYHTDIIFQKKIRSKQQMFMLSWEDHLRYIEEGKV